MLNSWDIDLNSRGSVLSETELSRSASLTGYADLARSLGLDPYRLAASAGVPAGALLDSDMKIPAQAVGRLLEVAARRSGAEDFGLRLAEQRRFSNMGVVALVAREQPSLRKALEVMGEHQWMQSEALSLKLREASDIAIAEIHFRTQGRVSRQAVELSVGVMCGAVRALLRHDWSPQAVMFRHSAPSNLRTYNRVFRAPVEFDQEVDGLVLRAADLDSPLPQADPAMASLAARYADTLSRERPQAFAERVSELIALLLPTGTCTADRVSRHLGLNRRTIHRRLAAQGLDFSTLLEERRRALVTRLLADSGRSAATIADLAGFASPSAFSHWCQRVLGASPRALRQSGRRGDDLGRC